MIDFIFPHPIITFFFLICTYFNQPTFNYNFVIASNFNTMYSLIFSFRKLGARKEINLFFQMWINYRIS
jgi:hypothetical protein